jgi:hypothetical protein
MKKLVLAAVACALLPSLCGAQDTPKADVSAGYSFLFVAKGFTLSMNGGTSAAAININHWLGIVVDFGAYDGSLGIPGLIGETHTFGPRFSWRRWNRLIPLAQAVIGGAHANSTNGGFHGANNAFAAGVGVGADVGLDYGSRFALRGQLDLLSLRANGNNTGTVPLSFGIVCRIGKQ